MQMWRPEFELHGINSGMVPIFTNKDISLIMRGRLYISCVRKSTLHANETWPVRKENEVALQWAEMRTVTLR